MGPDLILFGALALLLFVGGFLTGVGMYAWWHTPEPWELPDPTDEAAA